MKPVSCWILSFAGAGLVIAGVGLEGTRENPWNLFLCYMLPLTVLDVFRRRANLFTFSACAIVVGSSIYGAIWTLGPHHAASPRAALIYIGLVVAIHSSLLVHVKSKHSLVNHNGRGGQTRFEKLPLAKQP